MGNRVSVSPEVPFNSSSLYNGKALEPLPAINERQVKKFECGVWSDVMPDQLRLIIQKPERYREAIGIINTVSQTEVRYSSYRPMLLMAVVVPLLVFFTGIGIPLLVIESIGVYISPLVKFGIPSLVVLQIFLGFVNRVRVEKRRIFRALQVATSQANSLLCEEKVLISCYSNSKLLPVHVFLDGCRLELSALSQNPAFFHKAILDYSCAYAYCLAKRRFCFKPISNTGHLEGALCFCQYVICCLSRKRWCYCCRKKYTIRPLMSSGIDNPSYV